MDQAARVTPEKLEEIRRYAKVLRDTGIAYEALIVFGSSAKGTAKPWSDVDVCVVSRQFGRNRFDDRVRLMKLTDDDTINIEPHPLSPEELADPWDPLAAEIRRHGIRVT
ncbi:nucleotidyltransferase domain-containing protein [Candidatus Gottesmanbacteria bacterium]|nr:nucleotidyltransferase domain-containing protein [Candidatus Gottesmanbacteria bacterium]